MTDLSKYYISRKGEISTSDLLDLVKSMGYIVGHFALAKGYVPSKSPYLEKYKGRYGEGYILHIPNNETSGSRKSNRYHEIAYLV